MDQYSKFIDFKVLLFIN